MSKRLQIIISDATYEQLESTYNLAVDGFPQVKMNLSDVIEAMIHTSKVNLPELRLKHTDLKRALLNLAKQKDLSVEDVVSQLAELKSSLTRKEIKKASKVESSSEES